jgi:hypothetical protein
MLKCRQETIRCATEWRTELRALRETLGYRMRDVELASNQIAQRLRKRRILDPAKPLVRHRNQGHYPQYFPTLFVCRHLSAGVSRITVFYGLELDGISTDVGFAHPQKSHFGGFLQHYAKCASPPRLDPGFSLQKTTDMKRIIQQWGTSRWLIWNCLPMTATLMAISDQKTSPCIPFFRPEASCKSMTRQKQSQRGHMAFRVRAPDLLCGDARRFYLLLVFEKRRIHCPTTSSLCLRRPCESFDIPQEAEILGQVVGVAMRLGGWQYSGSQATPKVRSTLT